MGPIRKFIRVLGLSGVGACLTLIAVTPPATAATPSAFVRLAHLSPNAPAVDVYLYPFGHPSDATVLRHVSYGTVSGYLSIGAGEYTVAMRGAGAAPKSSPILSTTISVSAGGAYTVAGMGPASGLRLQVLTDRLTAPKGKVLVRVIQASLQQHVVSVSYGLRVLAGRLAFPSVEKYEVVAPGTRTVRVTGSSEHADESVTLAAGSIHTLVILDGSHDLTVDDLTDAAGSKVIPAGGPQTGLGGTAPRPSSPLPWVLTLVAGGLLAVAGSLGMRRAARGAAR